MAKDVQLVEPDYEAGQQIDLTLQSGSLEGTYTTRVASVKSRFLILDVPKVNGLYLPVSEDSNLMLKHYREGATFEAESSIELRSDDQDPPTIVVSVPDQAKRIQRRDFVRVPCEIDVTVRVLNLSENENTDSIPPSFSAEIDDISAGGVQIKGPHDLPENSEVELLFTLPTAETKMDEVFAEIVRESDGEDPPYIMGLEFTSITENKRNDIIQYVYDRQIKIKE
ncbi:MAG: flagellar brake protein [bacterium]